MTNTTIRSRPVHRGLRPILRARHNLVAVEGAGAASALRLLEEAPAGFTARTHLLCADGGRPGPEHDRLLGLPVERLQIVADANRVLRLLDGLLGAATMGTRLYAAGSEGFVGRVVRLGMDHGIDHRSVLTEHSGSLARRVQCVHCKHIAEDVPVSVYGCPGCGTLLAVRDHWSRRLAAFQGVCVDAEDPTARPAPEELSP